MATRRITTQEKTHLDQDDIKLGPLSNTTPAVPSSLIAKLLLFTVAMITLPIGSFFFSRNVLFGGNSTYAGALAAVMANVVLIAYIFAAFQDDRAEREADEVERKKAR